MYCVPEKEGKSEQKGFDQKKRRLRECEKIKVKANFYYENAIVCMFFVYYTVFYNWMLYNNFKNVGEFVEN